MSTTATLPAVPFALPDARASAESRAAQFAALTDAMNRYVDGEAEAFDEVFAALSPMVERCHRRWVGPALADDLTQQTFLKMHQSRDRWRPGSPVGPWVLAIARHLAIDTLRKQGRSRVRLSAEGDLPEPPRAEPAPDAGEAEQIVAEVRAAIEALPEAQRAVVSMHSLDGLSYAEVAERLGIKEGAARVRAFRAYGRLRERLTGLWSLVTE